MHDVARPRRLPDGETVYVEGDRVASLLVVNSGRLRLTRSSPDGGEHLLRVLDAGDFIGVESFLTGATPGHTATAMGATVLCEFRHADLQPLLDAHPGVGVAMLATLATQLSRTEERLTAQTLAPVERRLVGYLLDLPAQLGKLLKSFMAATQHGFASICPECQGKLVFEEGCEVCRDCGYSKCS